MRTLMTTQGTSKGVTADAWRLGLDGCQADL